MNNSSFLSGAILVLRGRNETILSSGFSQSNLRTIFLAGNFRHPPRAGFTFKGLLVVHNYVQKPQLVLWCCRAARTFFAEIRGAAFAASGRCETCPDQVKKWTASQAADMELLLWDRNMWWAMKNKPPTVGNVELLLLYPFDLPKSVVLAIIGHGFLWALAVSRIHKLSRTAPWSS